jgi:hypothetical protein
LVTDTKDLFAVSDDDVIDIFRISPGAETVFRLVAIFNVEKTSLYVSVIGQGMCTSGRRKSLE